MEENEAGLFDSHLAALEGGIADARAATKARDYTKLIRAVKFIGRIFVILQRVIDAIEDNKAPQTPATSGGTE